MPLGSLIEPLRPFTLPGPGGMPLTPASWANEVVPTIVASIVMSTAANNRLLPRVPTETDLIGASAILIDPFNAPRGAAIEQVFGPTESMKNDKVPQLARLS
jgi:hypothetical protein